MHVFLVLVENIALAGCYLKSYFVDLALSYFHARLTQKSL